MDLSQSCKNVSRIATLNDTMGELKLIFDSHTAIESYDALEKFFSYMMEGNNSISEHVLKMSGTPISSSL
jgi:hypothetical protein